jgi:hypothetical protein
MDVGAVKRSHDSEELPMQSVTGGAQFEFTLAAIAQNLRRLAKLMTRAPPENLAACLA